MFRCVHLITCRSHELEKGVSLFRKGNSSLKKKKKKKNESPFLLIANSFEFQTKWEKKKKRENDDAIQTMKTANTTLIHHVDNHPHLFYIWTHVVLSKPTITSAPNAYSWTRKDAKLFFAKLVFGQQCWHLYFRFECWSCSKFNVWV